MKREAIEALLATAQDPKCPIDPLYQVIKAKSDHFPALMRLWKAVEDQRKAMANKDGWAVADANRSTTAALAELEAVE